MFTLKEDNREKNIIEFFERAEKLREFVYSIRVDRACIDFEI